MTVFLDRRRWIVRPGCEDVRRAIAHELLEERHHLHRRQAERSAAADWTARTVWDGFVAESRQIIRSLRLVALSTRQYVP